MRDPNKKRLFEVHENGRGIHDVYHMIATDSEMDKWLKMKEEVYGYIPGVGGDRTYSAWAVYADMGF